MSWSDNEGYGDLSVQDIHEAQSDVDPYEHVTMLPPSAGKKYEWLRDFNGVEVPQERLMDIKQEAREILDAMYDGPLHQQKTWHQILHSHRIRGVAVLESKFPELTQCQGHTMADHILAECRHRQLERYRAGDRRREKRLKVEEDAGKVLGEEGSLSPPALSLTQHLTPSATGKERRAEN
ncbi:hypothetical protein BT69DRAFT_1327986 [Atractiella rhizophila]|nr:hypothetical protein BT69DRAFT_1327986 [Atractiella rhizophila]